MNAKKCDRCGKYYILHKKSEEKKCSLSLKIAKTFNRNPELEGQSYIDNIAYDFCFDCTKEFESFMAKKNKEEINND